MIRATVRLHCVRPNSGALAFNGVCRMRFDKEGSPPPFPAKPKHAELPESMLPKPVAPTFTPFPLPKYDSKLGFGPVRLSDIPDVEAATQRMRHAEQVEPRAISFMDASDLDTDLNAALLQESMLEPADRANDTFAAYAETGEGGQEGDDDLEDLGDGYAVEGEHFPVLDRLRCQRSVDDLLTQFRQRPAREARTATVLDLANTMKVRTDEQLEKMLYELGALFTADGNGLQFLAAKVTKFGRAYYAADELMKAFVFFVDKASETLVEEQPDRLIRSPALFIQLLHFLAQIKIFEPNLWYSPNPNAPSNRADYSHPRGINATTAHSRTGEELYDYMASIVEADMDGFLTRCRDDQLLDLLAGFGGVMPDGLPNGEVANTVLNTLFCRWRDVHDGRLSKAADVAVLERLYLLMKTFNIKADTVLSALLSVDGSTATGNCSPAVTLTGEAQQAVRGPDFFAAVAREKRSATQARAAALLEASVLSAKTTGDAPLLAALAESGFELLLSMRDKQAALATAERLNLDTLLLQSLPDMGAVARRLALEKKGRVSRMTTAAHQLGGVQEELSRTLLFHAATNSGTEDNQASAPPYVTMFEGQRVHPIRTLLSNLLYANQMDSVFLLHSSIIGGALEALVSAVRRLQSGKDALIVTTSCLRDINARAHYSRTNTERQNAQRALTIIAHEMEKGHVILLPATEEIALHDAGTYCDEDLMLWTVAAFFARELPLVRVNTLMSTRTRARDPHRHLKGEHSPLTASMDLYQLDAPLLQSLRSKELRSVTHHTQLRRKVRDRASRLHDINPSRARFLYRRDKAMFDKFHVTARHVAPGFSQGALGSDLRGLGYYTPDHPQVPFTPLKQQIATRPTAASEPIPTARVGQQ